MSNDCVTVVWFDPGVTTGLAVLSVKTSWIKGEGASNFAGLGLAVDSMWHAQVGRHYREWDVERNRAVVPYGGRNIIPRKRGQVARNDGDDGFPTKHPGNLLDVLNGRGNYGGADPTTGLRDEILQVTECQRLLDNWPDAAWGYEDFVPRSLNQTREFIAPVRLFSMMQFSEIVHGKRARIPFVQSASTAKSTATDERLMVAGLYRAGMPHATDAMRHAATFLRAARADYAQAHDKDDYGLCGAAWPLTFRPGVSADIPIKLTQEEIAEAAYQAARVILPEEPLEPVECDACGEFGEHRCFGKFSELTEDEKREWAQS